MSFLVGAGAVAASMVLLSFLRSGRFGLTVLALGAGYLIASLWTDTLASYPLVQLSFLSWRDTVFMALILLPGMLVLLFGHKQKSILPTMIAALAIGLLAVTLTLPVFRAEPQSRFVYDFIRQYREVIMAALLLLGLLDVAFSRSIKAPKPSKD